MSNKISSSKKIPILKHKKYYKPILKELLDFCYEIIYNNIDKLKGDEKMRTLYRKINECLAIVDDM